MHGSGQRYRSDQLEVGCGGLPSFHHHIITYVLPVIEPLQASRLNRRDMHKDVLAAILRHDEAVTLGRVEPLDRTCRHNAASLRPLPPAQRRKV